jgi:hypothetical protein
MNRLFIPVLIITGYFLLQGCATQKYANTIVRDEDNPCIIRIVVQLGVDGTDADVEAVSKDMEECFKSECFLPCENNQEKGCRVIMTAVVKKWSTIDANDRYRYHMVTMVDDDGLPSRAMIGKANDLGVSGTWRRGAHSHTYCHETMHFLGLDDKYCSRYFNAVTGIDSIENVCAPPPDPNGGKCCTPSAQNTRCSTPCAGHEHDLMATLEPGLSCNNVKEVLAGAGFGNCPEECCSSNLAYDEFFTGPSYLHFDDKQESFGAYGGTLNYTHWTNSKFGLTIDLGYYTKSEKDNNFKQNNNFFTIGVGVSYKPKVFGGGSKFGLNTHALLEMFNYNSKIELSGIGETKSTRSSLGANLGASLEYRLNSKFDLRLLQVDYMPTFFGEGTQNNVRVSTGLELKFGK